jgi:hypothetical protein
MQVPVLKSRSSCRSKGVEIPGSFAQITIQANFSMVKLSSLHAKSDGRASLDFSLPRASTYNYVPIWQK